VKGFRLTDQERADLVAFLESLTDLAFTSDPRFADPWPRKAGGR
jgi:cytochrome c peroxidase